MTGVCEDVAARAIALRTDGLGVGTHGGLASVLVALVSASFSPVFFRFAFFGLGLPFVSYNELPTQRETEYKYECKKPLIIIERHGATRDVHEPKVCPMVQESPSHHPAASDHPSLPP